MENERTEAPSERKTPGRNGGANQTAVAALLILVIAGAGYVAYGQLQTVMRDPKDAGAGASVYPSGTGVIDEEWLETATGADGISERFGEGDDVRVYAAVPPKDGHCHADAIALLRTLAAEHPDRIRVTVTLIHTAAAAKAGMGCAGYRINGRSDFSYTQEDGTVRTAVFNQGEGQSWTLEDLRMAVEAALAAEPEERAGESDATESAESAESAAKKIEVSDQTTR